MGGGKEMILLRRAAIWLRFCRVPPLQREEAQSHWGFLKHESIKHADGSILKHDFNKHESNKHADISILRHESNKNESNKHADGNILLDIYNLDIHLVRISSDSNKETFAIKFSAAVLEYYVLLNSHIQDVIWEVFNVSFSSL